METHTLIETLELPLVRSIAEQDGGSVEISHAPGEGTTATMVFPAPAPARS